MGPNVILFAWNRSLPGREKMSAQHFQEFVEFMTAQQKNGVIDSFDIVLLEPYGGAINGFFLMRGDPSKLRDLWATAEWIRHQVRGLLHLEGAAALRGVTGSAVAERMELWMKETPQ
jgi:non-ribosomal peptide synthetase component F